MTNVSTLPHPCMLTIRTITELCAQVHSWRRSHERIALVPTMGNLHAGHLKLVEEARARAERVVVSVFVNPLQFSPGEDFQNYPRTLESDQLKLSAAHADVLFDPSVEEMYPGSQREVTQVVVSGLSDILEGQFRPGHFAGVATVVTKLFNIVQPDIAVFGRKDYQQLQVIRRLVSDLSMSIEIAGITTVREADGLAMSSRNQYLTSAERERAPWLCRTLEETAGALRAGRRDFEHLQAEAVRKLSERVKPDYVAIRAADTLMVPDANTRDFVVLVAAWLGKARLIDNVEIRVPWQSGIPGS